MAKLAVLVISAIMAGCAASTPHEARLMGPEKRYTMQVNENYEAVYRKIAEVARSCYQMNLITASQIVNTDLYPETRSGFVSVGMYGAFGPQLYQVIDIKAIDDTHTLIEAVYPVGNVDAFGNRLRGWVDGSGSDC